MKLKPTILISGYRFALSVAFVTSGLTVMAADIQDGGEYYIVSEYYNKVLGLDSVSSQTPQLSTYGTVKTQDAYVFIAEKSSDPTYFYLKNKATGKYLTASTSNAWSIVWKEGKGTGNEYLWKFDVQMGRTISSKKDSGKTLGMDWSKDEFVKAYYNKSYNSTSRFTVVPVVDGGVEASLQAAETSVFTNDIGRHEKDVYQVKGSVEVTDTVDLHIVSSTPFSSVASVNVKNKSSWVIFDNVRPSEVINKWLPYIKVNGTSAINNYNVRVAIYLDGAAVIPCTSKDVVMTGYTETGNSGNSIELTKKNYTTLDKNNNLMRSFVLKRGYMAVVATGQSGEGYSRVYVADHADLVVNALPEALDRRVSSVHIKPWQYVSKKGWCSTQNDNGIAGGASAMKASWFYTWSADRSTTADCEYVPIRQHIYWPSMSTLSGKETSTHVLGFNEPDHSEQHDKCDCGGVISSWTATTKSKEMGTLPMRVGSPAPTDLSWVKEYIGHIDDMAYRCDYVALHAYWGPNEANGAQAWYNRLKDVYDNTKRPIWITEWAYGASWTSESWPSNYGEQLEKNRKAIFEIVNMLESCPFVERYSYYQWDTSSRRFINDDGWVTPAGEVYQKTRSTFAYNQKYQQAPNWWRPSIKKAELSVAGSSRNLIFTVNNTNGDYADVITLEHYSKATGQWTTLYEWSDRSKFDDGEQLIYRMKPENIDFYEDRFRVKTVSLYGTESMSIPVDMSGIVNADCNDGVNGWTVSNVETSKGEAADGDKENTYWNLWKQNGVNSSMKQTINKLPIGEYTLSVLARASSNTTIELKMTTISSSNETTTVSKTFTGIGATSPEGSELKNGWQRITLDPLMVGMDYKVEIELTAKGIGSSWWSADDFRFSFRTQEAAGIDIHKPFLDTNATSESYSLDGRRVDASTTHGLIIQNGKKVFRK